MKKSRLLNKVVGLITVALMIAPWRTSVSASDLQLSPPRVGSLYAPLYPRPLFADLDGDARLDEAELSSNGQYKNIRVRLSGSWTRSFSFDSGRPDLGRLVSGDIDHDSDQDLVWYSQTDPKAVFFWLNDGKGGFGPVIRYRSSDQQLDLDLGPLLNQDAGSDLSDQQRNSGTICALRTADSPVVELAARREVAAPAILLSLRSERRHVQSIHLKAILKRGPPTQIS